MGCEKDDSDSSKEYAEHSMRNKLSAENYARQNLSAIAKKMEANPNAPDPHARLYKCKECDKTFPKFQALGGHKASHKKPRSMSENQHECKICGEKFDIGQALGGHMRKHQSLKQEAGEVKSSDSSDVGVGHVLQQQPKVEALQELKVEALQELKFEALQEQKAKSDPSEGVVISKDDNFNEGTSTSDSGRPELKFYDLCVPADAADEDEGASHPAKRIRIFYEFIKPADV